MNKDLRLIFTTFIVVLGTYLTLIGAPQNYWEMMGIFASSLLIVLVIRMVPILTNTN